MKSNLESKPMTLVLKVGNSYLDRSNITHTITSEDDYGLFSDERGISWFKNGRRFFSAIDNLDLISEYTKPHETLTLFALMPSEGNEDLFDMNLYIPELTFEQPNMSAYERHDLVKCKLVFKNSPDWKLLEKS